MSNPVRPGPGRPRDESIDARILEAALTVYAAKGLSGFTVDQVARAAGCSRPAVSARFPTRTELLLEAVRSFDATLATDDVGSARDQLVRLAENLVDGFGSVAGRATFRIVFDSLDDRALHAAWEDINAVRLAGIAEILERGVERGELPEEVRSEAFLHALVGAAMAKAIYGWLGEGSAGPHDAAGLVDFLLGRPS
ncbi:TetR/AcrR family transcriptional regulator [Nocardioides marmoriginsengisoli]|uniref:TetR/AcrR family transcriptional regulator n=1 Tax=Nocardioides marmoriginsengisoli TaxID=661483 RepID=UPI00161A9016|nr:TetR/AcrR family transcriptional regulator [Nocardioides marmoriginsengisoli]